MRLDGLRVLDFCWIGAGAFVTRILADLGAEVIKVESRAHPDNLRLSPPHQPGAAPLESSGYFASRNTSKKQHRAEHDAAARARDRAASGARCSIVSNNFRPGVMDKWGLGYDAVAAVNPSVIYLSMPMQGAAGPHRDYIGFGSTIAALCGLVGMAGLPDRPPIGTGTHYPDHVPNPGHALVAVLAAVFHRARTGEGQYIELAQIESTVNVLGPQVLACSADGDAAGDRRQPPRRRGAARGVSLRDGDDTWCAIEVATDAQWQGLVDGARLARRGWTQRPMPRSPGVTRDEDEIEQRLAQETKRFDAPTLVELLQHHGVAAAVVQTSADVADDPQLRARRLLGARRSSRDGRGPRQQAAVPHGGRGTLRSRARRRCWAQHTVEIARRCSASMKPNAGA